jgi:nicotinamidase-related amidase
MSASTAPHFQRSALVSIDVQRDLLAGAPHEIPGTSAALPAMRRVVEAFRSARRPIVHIVRLYLGDGSNAELCRRDALKAGASMLLPATDGAEIAAELLPSPSLRLDAALLLAGSVQSVTADEVIMFKPRWGAFYRTPLEEHLRSLDIDTIVFIGCNFPNCPRTSMYEASERDFRVVCVEDAVSGMYDQGQRELDNIGVVRMSAESVADVIAALHDADVPVCSRP